MSSRDEQWWDLQAAEYVLGVLSEQDRAVFERLLRSDEDARQAVADWERRLDPLNQTTPQVTPSPQVFEQIIDRIDLDELTSSGKSISSNVIELKEDVRFWKTAMVAGMATVAAIAAALFIHIGKPLLDSGAPTPAQVAQISTVTVLEDESGQPIWALNYRSVTDNADISASTEEEGNAQAEGELIVSVVGEWPLDSDKSHQLWMVFADGSGVQSVGLMPNTPGESTVLPLPISLSDASNFAVSLEASGGTSEPAPEGPVVSINAITLPVGSI